MPGSRDSGFLGKLAGALQHEWDTTTCLVTRTVPTGQWDCTIDPVTVTFQNYQIVPWVGGGPVVVTPPAIHTVPTSDMVDHVHNNAHEVPTIQAVLGRADAVSSTPPETHNVPPIATEIECHFHQVTFEYGLQTRAIAPWRHQFEKLEPVNIPIPSIKKKLVVQKVPTRWPRKAPDTFTKRFTIRTKVQPGSSRFLLSPWVKQPISVLKIPNTLKNLFRKTLADKHKTFRKNIRINRVYPSMQMDLYQNIQPDSKGGLVCQPKSQAFRDRMRAGGGVIASAIEAGKQRANQTAYLVIGQRLDTQETVRALVPLDEIMDALELS